MEVFFFVSSKFVIGTVSGKGAIKQNGELGKLRR